MADPRLRSIYFNAGRLFNSKRYANTKVWEIAKASDIATGTVYNLFTSKKAILTFVIHASLDRDYLDSEIELPVGEADMKLLVDLSNRTYNSFFDNVLRVADENGKIIKSFRQLITEMFDIHADTLLATGNIETNAAILPELARIFFPMRQRYFLAMEKALMLYAEAGEIRKIEYPLVHVQSIIDISTWWAMNAYIAMPNLVVPREKAREIAVDLITRAYLNDR